MHLTLRLVVPLAIALIAMAWGVVPLVDRLTARWFAQDLGARSTLIARAAQPVIAELAAGDPERLRGYFARLAEDERLFAVGWCAPGAEKPLTTRAFPPKLSCSALASYASASGAAVETDRGPLHVSARALAPEAPGGALVLVHDMGFVERRSAETRGYLAWLFAGLGAVVALITVAVAQWSWRGWVRDVRSAMPKPEAEADAPAALRPLPRDMRSLVRELREQFRPPDEEQVTWSPAALRRILREDLRGDEILVVSNREPYLHVRRDDRIEVQRPAGGLVTALEPVMRACSGTWIAHGSGSADRDVVDEHDRVGVPPEHPAYQIRRVWLSPEEEAGYYAGFANEGLWPLCHIAHVRPTFRASDWAHYVAVNRRFAEAVVAEAKRPDPIVLVQDYHFALLPRMIRDRLPEATIVTFWHIPWPNPESFAICPWREELLDGMLGSSIMGFHTQYHCNNFFDTVDRLLEARVDRESFTISHGGRPTAVKRYPISIAWPPADADRWKPVQQARAAIRERFGLPPDHAVGLGIDRLDYTKGLLERFRAVERLLEMEPEWVGRFTFVQAAAPTRGGIAQYQSFEREVRELIDRINQRHAGAAHPPIILRAEHFGADDLADLFRGCDLCMVSSLHDGMNLVAKEFVATRDDDGGVLILSQFAGAAREMPEALIVNPYDTDQCAAALHLALTMPRGEKRQRMRIMRDLVREFNVYRWAGRMLLDAAMMRRRGRLSDRLPVSPAARTDVPEHQG